MNAVARFHPFDPNYFLAMKSVPFCLEHVHPLSCSQTSYIGCYFKGIASAQYIIGEDVFIINDCLQLVS